jgi:hypothetical protein
MGSVPLRDRIGSTHADHTPAVHHDLLQRQRERGSVGSQVHKGAAGGHRFYALLNGWPRRRVVDDRVGA